MGEQATGIRQKVAAGQCPSPRCSSSENRAFLDTSTLASTLRRSPPRRAELEKPRSEAEAIPLLLRNSSALSRTLSLDEQLRDVGLLVACSGKRYMVLGVGE